MLEELQNEIIGYISIGIGLIITLVAKDLLSSFVAGVSFFLDKNFKEGDNIILESEEATIVRIGIMRTIFRMKKNSNWYFVHNGRIKYLRLEKKVEQ
jgi:hypothetical protein